MNPDIIIENYKIVQSKIPDNVELVAVSKNHPVEKINIVYQLGQRIFGENKVQEMVEKQSQLPQDIRWNMIGHLQTNKVKYIAPFVDTIQSVDSEKLLKEISKEALKNKKSIKVFLQVKIAKEVTKFGLLENEVASILQNYAKAKYPNIRITGLMGMASFTEDVTQIQKEFTYLKNLYNQYSATFGLETLSMGMSDDFAIAIDCGANSVRIGSAIFGNRTY